MTKAKRPKRQASYDGVIAQYEAVVFDALVRAGVPRGMTEGMTEAVRKETAKIVVKAFDDHGLIDFSV